MSDSKHSRGPWEVEATETGSDVWAPPRRKGGERVLVAQINDDDDPAQLVGEPAANAKLIAAAPAMADALKEAIADGLHPDQCSRTIGLSVDETRCDCWVKDARAALLAAGRLP